MNKDSVIFQHLSVKVGTSTCAHLNNCKGMTSWSWCDPPATFTRVWIRQDGTRRLVANHYFRNM